MTDPIWLPCAAQVALTAAVAWVLTGGSTPGLVAAAWATGLPA